MDIMKKKKILCTGTVKKNNIPKNIDVLSDKILMKKNLEVLLYNTSEKTKKYTS